MSQGVSLQFSYTFAKSIMLDGMDFNNQFDFSNTHAPSLLDQRHNVSFAAVYRPGMERLTTSDAGRKLLSGWTLSSVMQFSSGRPYAALLSRNDRAGRAARAPRLHRRYCHRCP